MKLLFSMAIAFLTFAAYVAVRESAKHHTTQEKGVQYMDTTNVVYVPYRDTVYVDPSAGKLSEWDQYEVKITEDSLYVYDAQELITILHARECGKLHSILHDENN